MLTMKKILSFALVAIMLCSVALAAAPTVAEFTANNGFFIYENKSTKLDPEVQDPAEMADTANGLQVVHGGYYTSGDNCGGVVSNEKYDLNGFTATVYFEKAPEVTSETDCWFAMDFLAAPRAFYTNNFNVENGGNQGILNLIRFGKPYFEAYEGVSGFSQTYNSQSLDPAMNEMFHIVSGVELTVKVARTETNTYALTFSREGFEDFTVPYEWAVGDVFADGKAHFSVIASCEIAPENGWTYYIKNIENGVALTEEELAAMAAAKAAAELAANTEAATKETDGVAEDVAEIVARAEATGDSAAMDKAAEAQAAIDASYAAIEAADFEEARVQSDLARDLVKETKDLCKEAEAAAEAETAPEAGENAEVENNEAPATDDATAAEGGFPAWIWIVVAVVVVVVIVVVVLGKKKK